MNDKFKKLDCKLGSLVIFRNLLSDDVIHEFWKQLEERSEHMDINVYNYSEFVSRLYSHNVNLSEYILKAVLEDENFYIIGKAQGKDFDPLIDEAAVYELRVLQELSLITSDELKEDLR